MYKNVKETKCASVNLTLKKIILKYSKSKN